MSLPEVAGSAQTVADLRPALDQRRWNAMISALSRKDQGGDFSEAIHIGRKKVLVPGSNPWPVSTGPIPYPPGRIETGGQIEKCPTDGAVPYAATRRSAASSSFSAARCRLRRARRSRRRAGRHSSGTARREAALLHGVTSAQRIANPLCGAHSVLRARIPADRTLTVTMPIAYGAAVSRARAKPVAISLPPARRSTHPPLFLKGGVRTSSGRWARAA